MTDPNRVFDEGLQHERTALAWDRTGLAMIVAGALLLRDWGTSVAWLFAAAGALMMAIGAAVLAIAYSRYGRLHRVLRTGEIVVQPGLVRLVAWATVVFSLAAILRLLIP